MYEVDPVKPSSIVHFDWMTLVFPIGRDEQARQGKTVCEFVDGVLHGLKLDRLVFMPLAHGLYTYDKAKTAGNNSIIVAWYDPIKGVLPKGKQTFMVQMSGSGVETLESILVNSGLTVAEFVKKAIEEFGATFSRVDPCCNFFNCSKEFSARYVGEEAKKGNLITRSSSVRLVRKFSSQGAKDDLDAYQGASEGYTCYVGKNPKQLRIYNKLAERSEKVNLLYQVQSWSRWEFQLNGVHAQAFMEAYVDRGFDLVQTWIDWLSSNYRWIERVGHQEKRSRYPNASWYDNLIKTAKEKIKVRSGRQSPTFERQAKWIDKQVLPTFASIYYARLQKYVENGVSYPDAKKLAIEKVVADLERQAINEKVDWAQVSSFVEESRDL
ncbi:replication initiation factor domain-containing protein [Lactobacillus taiwanensis]|uniref:replication initiation factor domain-containing protein n=1 Tax=Lactobacillus taiwanensis TaxID=508451 RepID=UPI0015C5941B|nr:replication initiation factor domain-containing protein [Lactobacillus taiwanensis]